ncbi:MarR family transcriptional regulator [Nocardioides sp. Root1257]|uniref:MarR family winged helix-turn-helix transcriptional regulator n=1 Tax=unclassified Nocardioides TaxID=2615069 RepID=UPI0006F6525F|nr:MULTISPECIES: MarR family transcriptional regulator [unclassified Nocardioides]KQW47541.1 MarR family transcriptional regulator [Nocardioides sp. Root1257]KRC45697.1 MarR family transcriptional regulator [Nocardioides sp. Root224]
MAGPASSFTEGWQQTGSLLALRELIETGRRLRHVIARRAGLSESHLVAMEHLMRAPLGPAELARILDVSTAASTGLVDRLVQRGHVEREAHEQDRRRTQVQVTDSGREEMLAHLLPMFVALDRLDASFSDEERAVVERYLRGAIAALQQLETQPPPSEA